MSDNAWLIWLKNAVYSFLTTPRTVNFTSTNGSRPCSHSIRSASSTRCPFPKSSLQDCAPRSFICPHPLTTGFAKLKANLSLNNSGLTQAVVGGWLIEQGFELGSHLETIKGRLRENSQILDANGAAYEGGFFATKQNGSANCGPGLERETVARRRSCPCAPWPCSANALMRSAKCGWRWPIFLRLIYSGQWS